jgi:tetratricopeptide (TPR) repeat protein
MKTLEIFNSKITALILTTILFLTLPVWANAQNSTIVPVNPVMKISNLEKNTENPMKLKILNIDIKVIGQLAVTTLDMTYYNSNTRIMEGEFNFPLGEGQSVSRFALDMNGTLREGVVVEKENGRKTFEAVVRKGVDPGLLEKTEGNNFRARVYPLPAMGTRRIVIAFEQELIDKGNNDLYLLPLKISVPVEKFSIHSEVVKNQVKLDSDNELANLSFTQWNDSYVANFEQNNYTPDKQISLAFPHINDKPTVFTARKNNNSDSSYFYLNIRPQLSAEKKVLPKKVTLLWDNSNSARNRDIEKEIAIVDDYIKKIGNLTVKLVPFNIKTGKVETFNIVNSDFNKLNAALKNINFDGGTSFGCIDFSKFNSDEILVISDGLSNFGNLEPLFSTTPVITINSSITANHDFLTYLAQRSGGLYVNLNKLTNTQALQLLTSNNFHFISAQINNGNITDSYPSIPSQFSNTFSMAGLLKGKSATLTLNFGFGSRIVYSKKIEITADNTTNFELLQRVWAEKKIAELNLNSDKNKDEIAKIGKEFGIVTQNTSLIVLENLNDYLRYDIVPPKEMQVEYYKQKSVDLKDQAENSKKHLDFVVTLLDEQSKWWNTKFPLIVDKKVSDKPGDSLDIQGRRTNEPALEEVVVMESVAEMNIAPPPPPSMAEQTVAFTAPVVADAVAEENFIVVADKKDRPAIKADIQLNAWDPETPYLKVLQYAQSGSEYETYLKLKKEYGLTPSFYIDASDFFAKLEKTDLAIRILSNLAELELESPQLLRVLGEKLSDLNDNSDAVKVYEKVLKLKGEEPQSYRDLGLAYEAAGNSQLAIKTLYEVVKKEWDNRFPSVELIVMNEINNIIAIHPKLDYSFIDTRLIKKEPVNLRVVLTWDTDNCDMDLWVTDPSGEKCFYQHKLTRKGGKISNDFTGGYGPEEFMIKKADHGDFLVQVNYYGNHSQSILAPVNLHLAFITNFGSTNQKKQEITLRLDNKKDVIDVGKFSFGEE